MSKTVPQLKQEVFDYVALRLGEGIIDLELDPSHYEIAYQEALGTYRQRSQTATEESYHFLGPLVICFVSIL